MAIIRMQNALTTELPNRSSSRGDVTDTFYAASHYPINLKPKNHHLISFTDLRQE